jgi:hypothetical protein
MEKNKCCHSQIIEIFTNEVLENCIRHRDCFNDQHCPLDEHFKDKFKTPLNKYLNKVARLHGCDG